MRRDSGGERRLAGPEAEAAGHIAIRKSAAALREEEGALARIDREGMAGFVEIAAQGALGGLAHRQQPLLRALSQDAQLLGLEIQCADVEVDDLLAAQAAGVGELQHRPVAQLQRDAGGDPLQQGPHLLGTEDVGQLLGAFRAGDELGRVRSRPFGADEEGVEAANRGELAGNGRRRGTGAGEPGAVAADVAMTHLAGADPLLPRPLREAAEVDPVGAPGALGGATGAQVAVISAEGGLPVHRGFIRPGRGSSFAGWLPDEDWRSYFYFVV